jgi:hypothetical protein
MWQEITAQINDVVHETRSLPAPTGELGEVKTHIDQLPAAMQQVEDVQHLIIQHIERSTELTNTALLNSTQSTTDSNDALQSYPSQARAEIELVSSELQSVMYMIGNFLSLLSQDSMALKSEGIQALGRIMFLEDRQRALSSKAQELSNKAQEFGSRAVGTWINTSANAFDVLESLRQHAKSAEAELENVSQVLGDKRCEAINLSRISDVFNQLLSLLMHLAAGLREVINLQASLKDYWNDKDRLASLTAPENARTYLTTVLKLLQMMRAQAN